MSAEIEKSNSLPAGKLDEDALQVSQLVKRQDLESLHNPPKVVPWTLADFAAEEKQQKKIITPEQQAHIDSSVSRTLEKERAQLQKEKFEQAYQEGYEKGFALGKQEGVETGNAQAYSEAREFLFPKLQNLETLLNDLQHPYDKLEAHLFAEIAQFALHIAQKVILQKIHEPQWLLESIEQTIRKMPENVQEQVVEVFLNAEDLAFLNSLALLQDAPYCDWVLKTDASLLAGNCYVKQGFSSIHNDWQQRFYLVQKEIFAKIATKNNAVDNNQSGQMTPHEESSSASSGLPQASSEKELSTN